MKQPKNFDNLSDITQDVLIRLNWRYENVRSYWFWQRLFCRKDFNKDLDCFERILQETSQYIERTTGEDKETLTKIYNICNLLYTKNRK